MVNVLFLFPKTADIKTLDDFLSNQFLPRVKQVAGLRSIKRSEGDIRSPGGPPPYSRIVELSFDSFEEMMAIIQSPESQTANDFLKSLGTLILLYDVNEP